MLTSYLGWQVRARQAAAFETQDDDEQPTKVGGKRQRRAAPPESDADSGASEEDELYLAAARAAKIKKAARKERHTAQPMQPPLPDELADGARAISRAVEKNRGLTPHRRKDIKNPRVKARLPQLPTLGCELATDLDACSSKLTWLYLSACSLQE